MLPVGLLFVRREPYARGWRENLTVRVFGCALLALSLAAVVVVILGYVGWP